MLHKLIVGPHSDFACLNLIKARISNGADIKQSLYISNFESLQSLSDY